MMSARHLVFALMALAPLTLGQTCYTPPEVSCEHIDLTVDAFGRTTVMNFNNAKVTFDLDVVASVCTSSDCPSYGTFEGEALPPNSLGLFEADTPGQWCSQVYCCSSGAVYRASAELYLYEAGCTKTASVSESSTCEL